MIPQEGFHSPSTLRAAFEQALVEARQTLQDSGASEMLTHLSETVRDLQSAGADISLQIRAGSHSNAYDMIYTTSGSATNGPTSVEAYGFLRAGESSHLVAVCTQYSGEPVHRIYVSEWNAGPEGGRQANIDGSNRQRTTIGANMYDFDTEANALQSLQTNIAKICADNAAVAECDTGQSFNKPAALVKSTGLKLPR
ncbi:MAG: hypothetical protein PW788_01690 [Micavibrio sp.]|nr:hypothetical protein [Micavibrio sp.]